MKKVRWKCVNYGRCLSKCELETAFTGKPVFCPVDSRYAKWEAITEEPEQKQDEPETNCSQLPRLTTEVFERPDCPKWAKYAAVNDNGTGTYFENKPEYDGYLGCWLRTDKRADIIKDKYDASDWQNSLIERPSKLMDWCKVGEWVYVPEIKEYFKITDIQGENLMDEHGDHLYYQDCVQARLFPYNAEEMKALVGKVIEWDDCLELVTKYDKEGVEVFVDGLWANAEFLMNNGYTINGMPCGVLQNLKDGVWTR